MATPEKQSDYCKKCKFRARVNPEDKSSPFIGVNEKGFCELEYTQNPITETKTFNVAKNHGIWSICDRNPWRRKALIRMGLATLDGPFDSVSGRA